jgi:hypothetical protein
MIEEFRAEGVAVIRGAFASWVETLRKGVATNWAARGPDSHIYAGEKGGGKFLSDYCNWQRIPEYRTFIFESEAARVGAALMGAMEVRLFSTSMCW